MVMSNTQNIMAISIELDKHNTSKKSKGIGRQSIILIKVYSKINIFI
jgi:hypothetical protein